MAFPYEDLSPLASLDDALEHFVTLGSGAVWTCSVAIRRLRQLPPSQAVWWHFPFLLWAFHTALLHIKNSEFFCCPPEELEWTCCASTLRFSLLHLHEAVTVLVLLLLIQAPAIALGGVSLRRPSDRLAALGVLSAILALVLDHLFRIAPSVACLSDVSTAALRGAL